MSAGAQIRDRVKEFRRIRASDLLPHDRNWRLHPPEQAQALRQMLEGVGIAAPLIAYETPDGLRLIDGHLRRELHPDQEYPTAVLDVTEAEAAALLATFDPLAGMAQANEELLEGLRSSIAEFVDGGLLSSSVLIDDLLSPSPTPTPLLTDPDEIPAQVETRCKVGDLWELGRHRLLCGDCTDAETTQRLLEGEQADCVFTSPPYAVGVDYGEYEDTIENLRAMLPALAALWLEAVRPGGFAVVNFGDVASGRNIAKTEDPCEYPMALEYWPVFRSAGWNLWSRRVWVKPNARVHSPWVIQSNRAATDWEHIWTWKKAGPAAVGRVGGESQRGWFDSTSGEGVEVGKDTHGAGMPVCVASQMLRVHSLEGGAVYEPFAGTGTTLMAAEMTGRRCVAAELNPATCDIALTRWERATGEHARRLP